MNINLLSMARLFFFVLFCINEVQSQIHSCVVNTPMSASEKIWFQNQKTLKSSNNWICGKKIIMVNFHFIQDDVGNFNFNQFTDGMGYAKSGYDYAKEVILELNSRLKLNIKMNIPPNNSTQILDKNYEFILIGVFFHKNTNSNLYNQNINSTILLSNQTPQNQFDVFIQNQFAMPIGHGGNANTTNATTLIRRTFTNGYGKYRAMVSSGSLNQIVFNQMVRSEASLLEHEFNHLLTLAHTVKSPGGGLCRTIKDNGPGSVDLSCDDDCDDTPTAWFMRDNLNAPLHPG